MQYESLIAYGKVRAVQGDGILAEAADNVLQREFVGSMTCCDIAGERKALGHRNELDSRRLVT